MHSEFSNCTRRGFLKAAGIASVGSLGLSCLSTSSSGKDSARVGIYRADSYQGDLAGIIKRGLADFPQLRLKDKRVVLKPNLVEYFDSHKVNTNPMMVAAAVDAFLSMGAREVIIAEGPGHRRDTEILLEQSGLDQVIKSNKLKFVDLNLDDTAPIKPPYNLTILQQMYFPKTILGADLVVSMPKLKTHHWVGVTLSLKNLFGTVPSAIYGWPKNVLHWRGLDASIVDIYTSLRPGFAIIDGIEGMEGNGPLAGDTINSNVIIMGNNLTAVDATATRVMGLRPEKIDYLKLLADKGEPFSQGQIQQVGESIRSCKQSFKVLPKFAGLKETIFSF